MLADLALFSFLKIIAKIHKFRHVLAFRNDKRLTERVPNFSVDMGFGLHIGWAIEGAIGSDFKIDASYLSPNVNMASRLEAATRQFGVPILISGVLVKNMTARFITYLRQIDVVTVKGSIEPVEFWTIDMNLELL